MIADAIQSILTNMPLVLAFAAILCACLFSRAEPWAARLLSWLLLLSVGAEMLWAGLTHVFFPQTAAAFIGWQVSPFQFEVGVADIAMGVVAVISFWRGWEFRAAVVAYLVVFYAGVAIGHVHQMISAGDTSPGNFGLLLVLTLTKVAVLPWLLFMTRRSAAAPAQNLSSR